MTATKTAPTMTNMMHRVLKAVAKQPLSRKKIAEKAFGGNSVNLAVAINPLVEMKLVKIEVIGENGSKDDKKEELIAITAAGKKVAAKAPPMPVRASKADHEPLPKVGGSITKTYLGKEYVVKVTAEGFEFKGKKYPSLTAAAKAVRGTDQEVNGWRFFGLTKAKVEETKPNGEPSK